MNVELSGREMLKLTAISDETGSTVESLVVAAVQSYLNKIPDTNLPALSARAKMADELGNMVGSQSRRRAGLK
jgi:hypothetical protein